MTTVYKILRSISTDYKYSLFGDIGLFCDEQKGWKPQSYGCKDQLLIIKVILENCYNCNTNLSLAWIDCKKSLLVCPFHGSKLSWSVQNITGFRNFLSYSMCMLKTTLVLNTGEGTLIPEISVLTVAYKQGDSVSCISFCFALIVLSKLLNNSKYVYKTYDNTLNHLFYMDDLKLIPKNDQ